MRNRRFLGALLVAYFIAVPLLVWRIGSVFS
jgi:hypothetical protein